MVNTKTGLSSGRILLLVIIALILGVVSGLFVQALIYEATGVCPHKSSVVQTSCNIKLYCFHNAPCEFNITEPQKANILVSAWGSLCLGEHYG
jgi:hypothetical protein